MFVLSNCMRTCVCVPLSVCAATRIQQEQQSSDQTLTHTHTHTSGSSVACALRCGIILGQTVILLILNIFMERQVHFETNKTFVAISESSEATPIFSTEFWIVSQISTSCWIFLKLNFISNWNIRCRTKTKTKISYTRVRTHDGSTYSRRAYTHTHMHTQHTYLSRSRAQQWQRYVAQHTAAEWWIGNIRSEWVFSVGRLCDGTLQSWLPINDDHSGRATEWQRPNERKVEKRIRKMGVLLPGL